MHAAACRSSSSNYTTHHLYRRATRDVTTKELEAEVPTGEPATADLLLNDFTPDECRRLFPKNVTQATKAITDRIGSLINKLAETTDPLERAEIAQQIKAIADSTPANLKGLRVDVGVKMPSDTELWLDVGGNHCLSSSYLKSTTEFLLEHQQDQPGRRDDAFTYTPSILKRQQYKHDKYMPMLQKAKQQTLKKKRARDPVFLAPIISRHGEFSADVFRLVTICANEAYKQACQRFSTDGKKPGHYARVASARLKDAFSVATASGWGAQLRCAGLPNCS